MLYTYKKFLKSCAAFLLAAVMTMPVVVSGEKTVSSECDISDIEVPIAATAAPAEVGQALEIKAKSAILLEPFTGEILYESNADEVLPPASITKIMSLILVVEALEDGRLALEDTVTASEHASSMGGSQIWLESGEGMTVDDLLKATCVASANDATVALAEAVCGSEEAFVSEMNRRAEKLGMNSTVFVNCTGLDAEGHVTSAHDVALMSAELIKHPIIKNYTTLWMDTLRDGKNELVNTNKLVRFYEGTTGLKTGTTSGAGYCLAATAERDGMELVAVIMSGNTSAERFEGAKKLLDFGFANYAFKRIEADLTDLSQVRVKSGVQKTVELCAGEPLEILMKKSDFKDISQKINCKKEFSAPVKKGQSLGVVEVYSGETVLGEIPITAKNGVKKLTLGYIFGELFKAIFVP